jgi:Tfp pilus assembly PilM family ATPase
MTSFHSYFQRLLIALRVRMVAAGLDISDQTLRFAYLNGKAWQFSSVRLDPGILENGEIKDKDKFFAALNVLKEGAKLSNRSIRKKINVVLSFSSANVYSQIFTLPELSGEALRKAAELNLQMASPGDATKTYSSWEVVGKKEGSKSLDVLSSFIEKGIVDPMIETLFQAGFFVVAVEPRSFAVARVLRERGGGLDKKQSYLVLRVDDAGIEFLVLRNGEPYFEYGSRWKDIAEENGQISLERFQSEIISHLRQVLNFYGKHWIEPIAGAMIAANSLQDEIMAAITPNITFPIIPISIDIGQSISPEWLVGLGLGLRGLTQDAGRREINLLGEDWKEKFQEQHTIQFVGFWQVLMPIALALLIAAFVGFAGFLKSTEASLASEATISASSAASAESNEMQALQASSTAFNNQIVSIQQIEKLPDISPVLNAVLSAAASTTVTMTHFTFSGSIQPITVSGFAASSSMISAFEQLLSANPSITQVTLPLSAIQPNGKNYAFSLTFLLSH